MALRYVAVFFIIILLLGILGLVFGYLSLDTAAPEGSQLSLASWGCYFDTCSWVEEGPTYYIDSLDVVEEGTIYYGGPLDPDEGGTTYYGGQYDPPYASGWGAIIDEVEEPFPYYAPRYSVEHVEEWVEPYPYYYATSYTHDPWYVSAFPGIGNVVQQIIPGQSMSVRAPIYTAPSPQPAYPQPSCWISASPTSVGDGGSSTLSWSSFHASQASLTDFGRVPLSGSRLAQGIRNDRTYQLSVSGAGGSGNCFARISVRPQSAAPSCVISAYPSTIRSGQSSSLAWGSDNAASAFLSGVGVVATQGGTYVAPWQTTTYTLTVFDWRGASSACTTEVGVLP